MSELAFEHFDPAVELCSVDEHGRPVRPRKKPGRKPNPPSPAQRKAQNRAAQRAFRERKRREMKDAEARVQRALSARDEAMREVKKLRRRVKQLEFENNFFRGHVLALKLACYANRVDVHNFTLDGDRDYLGNEKLQTSSTQGIPSNLEFFLDRDGHVFYLQEDALPADEPAIAASASPSPSSNNSTTTTTSSSSTLVSGFNPFEALMLSPKLLARGQYHMPGSFDLFDDNDDPQHTHPLEPLPALDLTQTVSALAPQLQQLHHEHSALQEQLMDPTIIQGIMHTQVVSGLMDQITKPNFTIDQIPSELAALIPPDWRSSLHDYSAHGMGTATGGGDGASATTTTSTEQQLAELWSQLMSQEPLPPSKKSRCVIGPNGERTYPRMTTIEYLEELRLIPADGKKICTMFEPTELQRKVPHDLRIDFIPGADMRDQMILFQDYYDANELFSFLIESAIFMGGSIGNQDHWFVPPNFLRKYWFLCPSKVPARVDNSVEIVFYLGERMMRDLVVSRKPMYMSRDCYPEHFPCPAKAMIEEIHQHDTMMIDHIPPQGEHHQQPQEADTPSHLDEEADEEDNSENDTGTDDSADDAHSIPVTEDMSVGTLINVMETMPRYTSIGTLR